MHWPAPRTGGTGQSVDVSEVRQAMSHGACTAVHDLMMVSATVTSSVTLTHGCVA